MRPIDADAMIERLKEWDTKDQTDKALYNFTLNRINEQPTIQLVPHDLCYVCDGLEDGDTLYTHSEWDGGIGFDYIYDIHFCPKCGRRLSRFESDKDDEQKKGM